MSTALFDGHDVVLLDLDGTVFLGGKLIPGVRDTVETLSRNRVAVRYVTNNASKPPESVVQHLGELGLCARAAEVQTSAQAGAVLLADKVPAGSPIFVVGTSALASEVEQAGLMPVRDVAAQPAGVIQGHSPDTGWQDLADACVAIRQGAVWVACNADVTLPAERGELPGNGAMVAALEAATGRRPHIAGKPQSPLVESAVASAAGKSPMMVGDRLNTDISGARTFGIPSLMVLTGVNQPADLLTAPLDARPDYVAADMTAICQPAAEAKIAAQPNWEVRVDQRTIELAAKEEGQRQDAIQALRALCAAWWPLGTGTVEVRALDAKAKNALLELGLA